MLFYPLNFVILCHNWLVFESPFFETLSLFLCEQRESRESSDHSDLYYSMTRYSHFLQILSLLFTWLIWDIYEPLIFSKVRKLNFRSQERALLVQKVTKYNQLSITSRGLSGLWINCVTLTGNLLCDTFPKSSIEVSLLSCHVVLCFWSSSKFGTEYFPPTFHIFFC